MSGDFKMIEVSGLVPAPPDGWEYCGYGNADNYKKYFNGCHWMQWNGSALSDGVYPLATRVKKWRPATENDIGRADAQFRDDETHVPYDGKLIHIFPGERLPYVAVLSGAKSVTHWRFCEVAE